MDKFKIFLISVVCMNLSVCVRSFTSVPQNLSEASIKALKTFRLPNHTIPVEYNISLVPYFENFTFSGNVQINVQVLNKTSKITLNVRGLDIHEKHFYYPNNSEINIKNASYREEVEMYDLEFYSDITPGEYLITVGFSGTVAKYHKGILKSYYTDNNGQKIWLIYSHLEAMFARSAFPCFDEPVLKANFTMRIAHFSNQSAISNMDPESTSLPNPSIGDRVWTTFKKTPLMSVYLVSFTVSNFKSITSSDNRVQIWTRPDSLDQVQFALQYSVRIIDTISKMWSYNMTRVIPKFHIVAIPNFVVVGMENWGLIYFSESDFLCKTSVTSTSAFTSAVRLLIHEFVHQWVGDLVSPTWWSYLWINEGFAEFFQSYILQRLSPNSRDIEDFVFYTFNSALEQDAVITSHHLNAAVYNSNDAESVFDSTTYSKAASLIRMMMHDVGDDTFHKAMAHYLNVHAFKNVSPDDFLDSLITICEKESSCKDKSSKDFKKHMTPWLNKEGYPLLTVTRNYDKNHPKFTIEQERFLAGGRDKSLFKSYFWYVPFNYVSEQSPDFTNTTTMHWLDEKSVTYEYNVSSSQWMILNSQVTGFYRVNYDVKNWRMIANYLKSKNYNKIHVLNRVQMIEDAFALAMAGYLDYDVTFALTSYLTYETEATPWMSAIRKLDGLSQKLKNNTIHEKFKEYYKLLLRNIEHDLKYDELEKDLEDRKMLREKILTAACEIGSPNCTENAERQLLNYYNSIDPDNYVVPPDLKPWIFCEGVKRANLSVWEFLHERALRSNMVREAQLIFYALTCTRNEQIYTKFLIMLLKDEKNLYSTIGFQLFTKMVSNSDMADVILKFLVQNQPLIDSKFKSQVSSFIRVLAQSFNNKEKLQELKEFITLNNDLLKLNGNDVTSIEAQVKDNIHWIETYGEPISRFLDVEIKKLKSKSTVIESSFWMVLLLLISLIMLR